MECVMLSQDGPPIEAIWLNGSKMVCRVGAGGVTRIVVDRVAGQCGYVPWFAIYIGEQLVSRFNSAMVDSVTYAERADGE